MSLNDNAIKKQSEAAYKQWAEQWREHAKIHSKFDQISNSLSDFENIGVGRACLSVANGASFEKQIDIIKEHQHNVDILCCDKTLGHLLDNGIIPKFCMVCDANVDYETYMKPWEDKLEDTILFSNICGAPDWTHNGNWKDIYFFVNMDVLKSEIEFSEISGCKNFIPAGTNVSNAMVVFLTQSDDKGRRNFFGYDKILLTGYDYCWHHDGHYYSFNPDGNGKHNYMRHLYLKDLAGKDCYSSTNLTFSAQWFEKYVKVFKAPVIQCNKHSLVKGLKQGDLLEEIQYNYKKDDQEKVRKMTIERSRIKNKLKYIDDQLRTIGKDHFQHAMSG